ncbi:hypothetical protein GQ43DRAFT_335070, partial [Delitschia confertaspora ATCC 74209]
MAEILPILGAIATSANILNSFAGQVQNWRLLSDRLFDIQEGLDAAELTLEMWRRKFDVQDRRPVIYMHVLFGRLGWERIQQTLGSIRITSRAIKSDIDGIVGRAKRYRPPLTPQEQLNADYDVHLVHECIRRIERNTSWTRKFKYSVLGKADELQIALERLDKKLTVLERLSDGYLEREHPEIFHDMQRLPGRRLILRVGDARLDSIQHNLLQALSSRRDAELLHRASGQGNRLHIGISVPQMYKRDFAFLLSIQGRTQEVLVQPVKFKSVTDRSRLQPNISSAVPALLRNPQELCYMLPPSAPLTAGFQVSIPPSNLLLDLEYKDPLSTFLTTQTHYIGQQILYPQDQVAIACGIVKGCFRLLESQWLQFMDCRNIRWRRSAGGNWTIMMAAIPGDAAITRTLDQVINAGLARRRDQRNLTKHTQIFRIGLLLVELALKTPITYIDWEPLTGGVRIFIVELGNDALDATDLAAEVETRTNVLYANIVYFCLSVLQDRELMGEKEREIEGSYYREALGQATELEGLVRRDRRRGV